MSMEYMSCPEAAKKWGVSERRVQKLCEENRISGISKLGNMWLIPKDAEKPKDKRLKKVPTVEEIITQYGTYVYNLALRLSAHPELADDLTQNTFIKAWEHIHEVKNSTAIKQWLRTICINEFRMSHRKNKHFHLIESPEELEKDGNLLVTPQPLPQEELMVSEEVKKLRDGCFLAMTRKLSINQRIAFSLVDMFGLSINEVAEILALSPKAIKGLLYRARRNLESFFQGHCSLLDIDNPCQCSAWTEFVKDRNTLQAEMRERISVLYYKENGYVYNAEAEQKILSYYHNLPEQRPNQEWFDKVISLVEDFYKKDK